VVTLSVLPFLLRSSSAVCAKPHADHAHNPIASSVLIVATFPDDGHI
jgi:hypothetical protein